MGRLFSAYALGVMGIWGAASWSGWEFGSSRRGFIPQTVRQAPGGYRSYTYWRGGK